MSENVYVMKSEKMADQDLEEENEDDMSEGLESKSEGEETGAEGIASLSEGANVSNNIDSHVDIN
jgi:hypothetical protein